MKIVKANYTKYMVLFFIISIQVSISYSQTILKSKKFGYSYNIPTGWYQKTQTYYDDVDSKFIDGKGNSFVVVAKNQYNNDYNDFVKNYSALTNEEIEDSYKNAYVKEVNIIRRGLVNFGGKNCYFIETKNILINDGVTHSYNYYYITAYTGYSITASVINEKYLPDIKKIIKSFVF